MISKESPSFGQQCQMICGTICWERNRLCETASDVSVCYALSQGKLYSNMVANSPARKSSIQDLLNLLTISDCIWVEHEEEDGEQYQTCLESKAGYGIERLSHIEFLISSEINLNMFTISKCISFGTELTNKLCKKVNYLSDKLCYHFGIAPLENTGPSIVQQQTFSQGWPAKPTLGCYACLTSRLDIFIVDLIETWSFLKVGALKKVDCSAECGTLRMVEKGELDISSIRPIPSKSLVARYSLTGRKRSHVPAVTQIYYGKKIQRVTRFK